MPDEVWLDVHLKWADERSVAAFEPQKVLRRLAKVFAGAEIDSTDHLRERLERELAFWSRPEMNPVTRATLIRSSWDHYARTGPVYRFVVPLPSAVRVAGWVNRHSVTFKVPADSPDADFEQVMAFLRSLGMGEPNRREPKIGGTSTAAVPDQ